MSGHGEDDSRENVVENLETKKDTTNPPEKQFLNPDKVGFQVVVGVVTSFPVLYRQMKCRRLNSRRDMAS